jgi:glycosyl transferase, family 25
MRLSYLCRMPAWFQSLNDYYDHIYVLSVESATERRTLFAERFNGLEYAFFLGADKAKFSIEQVESDGTFSDTLARKQHRFGKTMKHGEIACSLSHRMMYQDMLVKKYDRVLIFEDDAVPDSSRLSQIPDILAEVPADCELLMWGWDKNGEGGSGATLKKITYHLQHSFGKLKWDHTMIRNLYARPFSKNLKKAGFHDYTYAYAVNRTAAEKLIRMQTPVQYIADNLLAHAATKEIVNGFIVSPPVFLHDSLPDGTHRDSYIR